MLHKAHVSDAVLIELLRENEAVFDLDNPPSLNLYPRKDTCVLYLPVLYSDASPGLLVREIDLRYVHLAR